VSENYFNKGGDALQQEEKQTESDINLAGGQAKKPTKLNEMFVLRSLKVMVKRDQM